MLSPNIETNRLILRRYNEIDLDAFYEILHDERLHTYIPFPDLTKEEECKKLYNEVKKLIDENKINVKLINALTISPLDTEVLDLIANDEIIVYEEVYQNGSLADRILNYYNDNSKFIKLKKISLKNTFLETGTREELLKKYNISLDDLLKEIGD